MAALVRLWENMGEKGFVRYCKALTYIISIHAFSDYHMNGVIIAKRNVFYIVHAMKLIIK